MSRTAPVVLFFSIVFYTIFSALSVSVVMPFVNLLFGTLPVPWDLPYSSYQLLLGVTAATWICFFLKNIFHGTVFTAAARWQNDLAAKLRRDAIGRCLGLSLNDYHQLSSGLLITRLTHTIVRCAERAVLSRTKGWRSLLLIAVYVVVLLLISWQVVLLAVVLVPPVAAAGHLARRRLERLWNARETAWTAWMQHVVTVLRAFRLIRVFDSQRYEADRLTSLGAEFDRRDRHRRRAEAWSLSITEMIGVSAGLVLLYSLGRQQLDGVFAGGPGGFVLFIAAAFSLIDPLKELFEAWQFRKEAAQLHADVTRWPGSEHVLPSEPLLQKIETITVERMTFAYPHREPLFRDVSIQIARGKKIVVRGASGCGKSTLIDLLVGLQYPLHGSVRINDIPVHTIRRSDLARHIGVLSQTPFIFQDSLAHNLRYDRDDISDERCLAALHDVQLDPWLAQLPRGLDTPLHEAALSGGEQQRLTLARVLLRQPDVLILDEATSALDAETEKKLLELVCSLFKEQTVIFVSHRDAVSSYSDEILTIADGRMDVTPASPRPEKR